MSLMICRISKVDKNIVEINNIININKSIKARLMYNWKVASVLVKPKSITVYLKWL